MRKIRALSTVTMLALVIMLAAACAGPATPDQVEEVAGGVAQAATQYMPYIRLPRVVLDYGTDGVPRLFGARASALGDFLDVDLDSLNLEPATVDQLIASNIQHVEAVTTADGLFVYVNGKRLPYLTWSETSLDRTGDLISAMNAAPFATAIDKALPLLPRLGIDLLLQFPVSERTDVIPLREREAHALVVPGKVEPPAAIDLIVSYSGEGVPSVAGITTRDLQRLTGLNLRSLELPASTIQTLQDAGVDRITVVTQPDGLHLSVNGDNVFHLAYTQDHLNNAVEISRSFLGESSLTKILSELVPLVYATNMNLILEFQTRS